MKLYSLCHPSYILLYTAFRASHGCIRKPYRTKAISPGCYKKACCIKSLCYTL